MRQVAIFGAGGFGLEVAMLIEQINGVSPTWDIVGFFDDGEPCGKIVNGYPVLGGVEKLNKWPTQLSLALAIGAPKTKRRVLAKIQNAKVFYPVLMHPSVILGKTDYVSIGEGSILCAGVIVTTNITIGNYVILNLGCTVGHQCQIGDYSSFMPTCNISGEVIVGEGNFWGTGAKAINRKKIGNNVIVGAGSVIIDDIPDSVTVVGVPGRVVKVSE